ncbi:MAG: isochorismatase family protein, partial [Acidimicrobiales bacterium]
AGIATSGVVLSTTREAADRDFRLVVLSDGCRDADPEVELEPHRDPTWDPFAAINGLAPN